MALMGRAFSQAQKFGVEIADPRRSGEARMRQRPVPRPARHRRAHPGRAVVIATGARYRRLERRAARGVRRHLGPLLGLAAGSRPLRRRRKSRWSAAAIRRARRRSSSPAARARVTLIARRPLERDHVAISDRADRAPAQYRRRDRLRDRRARRRGRVRSTAVCLARPHSGDETRAAGPLPLLLHRRRTQHRLAGRSGLKLDERGFVLTGDELGDGACRSKPAAAACSRSATSAPARSSASRRRLATAPRSSPRSTPISPRRARPEQPAAVQPVAPSPPDALPAAASSPKARAMLLAIDAGNTNLVFALVDGGDDQGALADRDRSAAHRRPICGLAAPAARARRLHAKTDVDARDHRHGRSARAPQSRSAREQIFPRRAADRRAGRGRVADRSSTSTSRRTSAPTARSTPSPPTPSIRAT